MENLNIHGMFQQKISTKTTKNRIIQTTNNDKIQITMVRKKIHTSRPFFPIQPTMQQLRIQKTRPNTKN